MAPSPLVTPGSAYAASKLLARGRSVIVAGQMTEPHDARTKDIVRKMVDKKPLSPGDTESWAVKRACMYREDGGYEDESESDSDGKDESDHERSGRGGDGEDEEEEEAFEEPVEVQTPCKPPSKPVEKNSSDEERVVAVSDKKAKSQGPKTPTRPTPRTPTKSTSQSRKRKALVLDEASDLDDEERHYELQAQNQLQQQRQQAESLAYSRALAENKIILEEKRALDWHPQELFFFERLAMRGNEPIFHVNWNRDFRTFPHSLFTADDGDTFIGALKGSEFTAIRALEALIALGSRVRAKLTLRDRPEKLIKKEIEAYIRWSETDAGYSTGTSKPILPRILVIAGQAFPSGSQQGRIQAIKITSKLRHLALEHSNALANPQPFPLNEDGTPRKWRRDPPVVYAIVAVMDKLVFVSLDSAKDLDNTRPTTLIDLDLAKLGMDVWNGIAISMLCMVVRNSILEDYDEAELVDDGETGADA